MVFLTLLLDFRGFLTQPLCLLTGRLHLLTLLFQLGKDIFKILITLIYQVVRFFQDFLRQAKLPGNGEGVGLSGDANEQFIGRTQCFHVKFTGGVDDSFCAHGVEL